MSRKVDDASDRSRDHWDRDDRARDDRRRDLALEDRRRDEAREALVDERRAKALVDERRRIKERRDAALRSFDKAYKAKDFHGARRALGPALIDHPDDPALIFRKGKCFFELERYDEALVDFNKSWSKSGSSSDLRYRARDYRGLCFERMRQYDQAIREFTEALKLRPQEADTYCSRARNYFMLGRHQEALADCD